MSSSRRQQASGMDDTKKSVEKANDVVDCSWKVVCSVCTSENRVGGLIFLEGADRALWGGWGLSVENGAKCEPHDTRQRRRRGRRRGRGNVCVETMRNVVMIEVTEIRKLNFTVDFTTLAPLTRSSRGTTIEE